MYTAIKQQQILQLQGHAMERASISSGPGALLRAGSRRGQNDRVANLKRGSMRGIQSLFNAHGSGSPLGNDGRASPVPSFGNSSLEVGMNVSSMSGRLSYIVAEACCRLTHRRVLLTSSLPRLVLHPIFPTRSSEKHRKTMPEVCIAIRRTRRA